MEAVAGALDRDPGGVAVVWCPELGLRNWLVGEVQALLPTRPEPLVTATVEEAIAARDRPVLLVPADERAVVLDLDGSRDQLFDLSQPLVLFLLRAGDGLRALAEEAPGFPGLGPPARALDDALSAGVDARSRRG